MEINKLNMIYIIYIFNGALQCTFFFMITVQFGHPRPLSHTCLLVQKSTFIKYKNDKKVIQIDIKKS